jgi:hypothetical protein
MTKRKVLAFRGSVKEKSFQKKFWRTKPSRPKGAVMVVDGRI